jgi:hypothetical protein
MKEGDLMKEHESHISDRELLMAMDGELAKHDMKRVGSHLESCWTCRSRKQDLKRAIADFVHLHRSRWELQLPPSAGPRALLKARLAELAEARPSPWRPVTNTGRRRWVTAAACGLLLAALAADRYIVGPRAPEVVLAAPNPALTPGAAVVENPINLCRESMPKNKAVPSSVRRRVFAEYGVANAPAKAYEVDYLITPALGGSDDIHNLWPHSYGDTEWNAKVKDALEDRLRELVCQDKVDLSTAQREIANNWIAAYKKYFHTEHPIRSQE